jgi:hypothetical protein
MTVWAIALTVAGVVLSAVVVVTAAAMVEVFRQLKEMRTMLALDDLPVPLDLREAKIQPADLGLQALSPSVPQAIIVVLSAKCSTCVAIAQSFAGGAPSSVWFVIQAVGGSAEDMITVLSSSRDRLVVDPDGRLCERIGLQVSPSVLTVRWGEVVRAEAVSSVRQVLSLVPVVTPIGSQVAADLQNKRSHRESKARKFAVR